MEQGKNKVILSSAYLAPVQYFSKLATYVEVWIEVNEHFLKQSYRNRCTILTANGPQNLSIPITEGSNSKRIIRDVAISYDYSWQKQHWKAMLSAYNRAPFFEYYADHLAPFYQGKKWEFLIDFNAEIQAAIFEEINLPCAPQVTVDFCALGDVSENMDDFRYSIDPKPARQRQDPHFIPTTYMQVFQEKFGFTPHLSILDLLFNEGPMALDVLRKCHVESIPNRINE